MTTSISVKNLSKSYVLNHQVDHAGSYVSLRDVIVQRTKNLLSLSKQPKSTAYKETETFWALDGLSFDISQGERVGIIGRNGAGKSTLLKVISRITAPTKGQLSITGRVASLLEVGTGFHPELTGRENIYLNGAVLGMSRRDIKGKFDEIVAFAEVERFLDTPVKRYSSGMYMRLAFSVAAHLEPDILVVDEVLAVGDAAFQKKCLGKMRDVGHDGRTVLFVSHNMGAISEFCNRAILLEQGKVFSDGSPSEIIALYSGKEFNNGTGLLEIEDDGSKESCITRISMSGDDNKVKSYFDLMESISIDIDYIVREKLPELQLTIILSKDGLDLFQAFDNDMRDEIEVTNKGKYRSRYSIPRMTLKEGVYTVKVLQGLPHKLIQEVKEELVFEVSSNQINLLRKSFRHDRVGCLISPGHWMREENYE